MKDQLVRVISNEANVRAMACLTTATVNEACARHATLPTASVALGRAMTGAVVQRQIVLNRDTPSNRGI